MSLIQMSVSGGVLILVTAVIRAVAIDRLPKGTFPALWGIALLRLLLPVSISSSFSVYSLVKQRAATLAAADTIGLAVADGGVQASPAFVWSMLWGIGAVLLAAVFVMSYLRCRREFQTSLPVENDYADVWLQKHRLRRNIQIRELAGISTPLTYGLLRPVILLPEDTDWEDTRRLDHILFHEYVHIRRWDGLVKLAATAALCVHWFNPLVWVLYILLNRDIELACDAAVLRHFGKADRADYARMLITMKGRGSRIEPLCSHFGKNVMERRVKSVMKYRKSSVFTIVLAIALTGAVAVAFGTSAKAADIQKEESQPIGAVDSPGSPADTASEPAGSRGPAEVLDSLTNDREHTFYINRDGQKYPVRAINIADVDGFYTLTNKDGAFEVVVIDRYGAEKISEDGYVMVFGGTK